MHLDTLLQEAATQPPDTAPHTDAQVAIARRLKGREIWGLLRLYWMSADRRVAWLLAACILTLLAVDTWVAQWLADFTKEFFDTLETRNAEPFVRMVWTSLAIIAASALSFAAGQLLTEILAFRWRRFLVEHFTARLFNGSAHYRLEHSQMADNPDQRIADDTLYFASRTLSILTTLIRTTAQFLVYAIVLWNVIGPTQWLGVDVPGLQLWAAILFGGGYSLLTHMISRRLSALLMEKERRAADFRFTLAQQREAAEQIALYQGGPRERQRLLQLFAAIARNWRHTLPQTLRIDLLSNAFLIGISLLPAFILAPAVFAGHASLGDLMQTQLAFSSVALGTAWFGQAYVLLAEWSATTRRLIGLEKSLANQEAPGIKVRQFANHTAVTTHELTLQDTAGRPLARIADLHIEAGQRWLIRGPSGIGKSTLLRAVAGLWPHGSGEVLIPSSSRLYFLPQKAYLPTGSLREALAYPSQAHTFSHSHCVQILQDCQLGHLVERLDETNRWAQTLSLGEQQRLALARLLLNGADFVFLDEATSALDPYTETMLYRLLLQRLPNAALVSVAHRDTLSVFHDHQFDFGHPAPCPHLERPTP
jgi:putative ATP-binding cassette transporter